MSAVIELVPADAVARALSTSTNNVRRMAKRGDLPCVRINARVIRFDMQAVLSAISERNGRPLRKGA